MHYISTRGQAPDLSFCEALLAGLARDGGLYIPHATPALSAKTLASFSGQSYIDVAQTVLSPFIDGEISAPDFHGMLTRSYDAFRHPSVCPLIQMDDNLFVLEVFHGPTLAFKDIAMRLLGQMMDHILKQKGQRATIVGATSGDTGSAAMDAFMGLDQVDVFILYPHGRVSEVQRRQMTTPDAPNVHALALEGTFDDAQALVKGMFNHHAFRDEVGLSGVNSINWGRIAAQIVYYITSAVSLGAPHRPVSFSVPTGNFGDVLAGYFAKQMGLPVHNFCIATNQNDILVRTLQSGRYEVTGVNATVSPSMDIQVSSNFERLLFEAYGRDASKIRGLMASLQQSKSFTIEEAPLAHIRRDFSAEAVNEAQTLDEIRHTYQKSGYLLDPHTAVGSAAARRQLKVDPHTPQIVIGTAHPAKFPDAVEKAVGLRPALPPHMADLYERKERFTVIANDQAKVEAFIRDQLRT
jgi:threonine synthase